MFLTELAGRKTVAQMTMLQMIVTIGVGEALLMPVVDKEFSLLKTIVIVSVMVGFIIVNEWLEVKFNWYERLFTPKAKLVVEDGKLNVKNLKKLRLTVDQLEMYLRNLGIDSITQLKTVTVEPNGLIGYQLKSEEQHITIKDMQDLQQNKFPQTKVTDDLFEEIRNDEHNKLKNNLHEKELR
jgi:uncharacterized membrane protein YcaP (DUF421 family)